jgi:hypothetical protein
VFKSNGTPRFSESGYLLCVSLIKRPNHVLVTGILQNLDMFHFCLLAVNCRNKEFYNVEVY